MSAIWDDDDVAKLCEAASEVYPLDLRKACDGSSAIAQRIVERKLMSENFSFIRQAKRGKCQIKQHDHVRPTCRYQLGREYAQAYTPRLAYGSGYIGQFS